MHRPEQHPPPPVGRSPIRRGLLIRAGNPPALLVHRTRVDRVFVVVEFFSGETLTGGGLFLDLRPWLVAVSARRFFSALFWWAVVRGITRSIAQMTQPPQQIAEGHSMCGSRRTPR